MGWRESLPWSRVPCRGATTVGNMLDFRRVGGAGPRIVSTVVSRHPVRQPEGAHASSRIAQ